MNTVTQTFKQIGFFTIALTLALVANFAYGQWVNPAEAPVGGNIAAPINESGRYQIKVGDLGVDSMYVASTSYSDRYCNFDGTVCATVAEMLAGGGGGGAPTQLVNNVHTPAECLAIGGSVDEVSAGDYVCRLSGASCPAGWTQYQSWSSYDGRSCGSTNPMSCGTSCTVGSRGWSNISGAPTCGYRTPRYQSDGACHSSPPAATCTAPQSEIGCY